MIENGANLLKGHPGKPLDELGGRSTVFEILKQCGHRDPRTAEHPSSADAFRVPLDCGAGGPIDHTQRIPQEVRLAPDPTEIPTTETQVRLSHTLRVLGLFAVPLKPENHPPHPVLDEMHIPVDQKSQPASRQLQIRQQLGLVNGQKQAGKRGIFASFAPSRFPKIQTTKTPRTPR